MMPGQMPRFEAHQIANGLQSYEADGRVLCGPDFSYACQQQGCLMQKHEAGSLKARLHATILQADHNLSRDKILRNAQQLTDCTVRFTDLHGLSCLNLVACVRYRASMQAM